MKRILLQCILTSVLVIVAGCRTAPPENKLTDHEEKALLALTQAVQDQKAKVVAAEKSLATLRDEKGEQAAIQKATSDLEHHQRILKVLEDRWNQEREELIRKR